MATYRRCAAVFLLFIDACHAGEQIRLAKREGAKQFDAVQFVHELSSAENGRIGVFASSNGRALSYGNTDHSHFTRAVIESLGGEGRKGQTTSSEPMSFPTGEHTRPRNVEKPQRPW